MCRYFNLLYVSNSRTITAFVAVGSSAEFSATLSEDMWQHNCADFVICDDTKVLLSLPPPPHLKHCCNFRGLSFCGGRHDTILDTYSCPLSLSLSLCLSVCLSDQAVFDVDQTKGLTLVELWEGLTPEDIKSCTGADFQVKGVGVCHVSSHLQITEGENLTFVLSVRPSGAVQVSPNLKSMQQI